MVQPYFKGSLSLPPETVSLSAFYPSGNSGAKLSPVLLVSLLQISGDLSPLLHADKLPKARLQGALSPKVRLRRHHRRNCPPHFYARL